MIRMRTFVVCCVIASTFIAGTIALAVEPAPGPAEVLRAEVMRLLEDIEQTRMLLGITMWKTHDLRNFVLYEQGPSGRTVLPSAIKAIETIDRENLRLYEAIRPIDYAGSSLMQALDIGDARTAAGDLAFIRAELGTLARQVLEHCTSVAAQHDRARMRLDADAAKAGLKTQTIAGKPWADPVREYQRKIGVQIGWRTNIEPPDGFREHLWNTMQGLDIRYQLKKGRMIGVTHLVFKDPVLRWDFIEPQKDKYDFGAFDRMMKLAIDNGYRVKLVLPTFGGRVPDWLLQERPESVIRNDKGECDYRINPGSYAHDFMGPVKREGPWYESRPVNLADTPTRERFAKYVQAIGDHCRQAGFAQHAIAVSIDLNFAQRHWRLPGKPSDTLDKTHWTVPAGADRDFIIQSYKAISEIAGKAFAPLPLELEVTDGEAHGINWDFSAHEWRSQGLTDLVGVPGVCSETPFFEDLMRATASVASARKLGKETEAGPFFYQDCEWGFGTMISINYFSAFLRDGLWSDGWFGPEGPLRWGYFPQVFAWNDRQLQWSGITNAYLAHRQAHLLSSTIANTRVTPADVVMLLPSFSMDLPNSRTHRELIGWAWALTALKIQYDVITESSLTAGIPPRAKMLILPQATVLSDAQAKPIRSFVQNGGILIASLVPGPLRSDGTDSKAPSPLADVLGCNILPLSTLGEGAGGEGAAGITETGVKGTCLQVTVPHGMHSGKYTPVPPIDEGYPRKLKRDLDMPWQALDLKAGAKAIATYGTGPAAVAENTFGKGRVLTLGYPYGHELIYADWTSIAFGKIYNGWARDEQMLGMVRWLRDQLARIGYQRQLDVPEGWRSRLQGFDAAASSLSFPKGPGTEPDKAWTFAYTYLDVRRDHRIPMDHDEMDYAAELTWRDRPGVSTRYLAVGNRESAYSGERACVQFWQMPHVFHVRINDPEVKQVYDISAQAPVKLRRDKTGVSFLTSVPPALGRVFAVSKTDTVELFAGSGFPGASFDAVAESVSAVAGGDAGRGGRRTERPQTSSSSESPALPQVLEPTDIRAWLASRKDTKLTICYGDKSYRAAADDLAKWLKDSFGIEAEITADDGAFDDKGKVAFQANFAPSPAEILIGNEWSNNSIAAIDCYWPYNNGSVPALANARFTATYAWPGGQRGLALLTRERDYRRAGDSTFGLQYGNTDGFAPMDVDSAKNPWLHRKLLILASTPAGAGKTVKELIKAASVR